ncbi:protein ABSCISIC ACID-INSENSITIVE 5-like [Tasmannia lanceolata]|uniref:protein ABSCISIC ACID-INSENSITIVE 5-like n=1 Tax=Tasmannia lanceolata TaxID=3420 RepID=UPI004064A0A8
MGSNQDFSLMTQPSIYSLTLDEFQNTICQSGKDIGSMNMDEFVVTAEELGSEFVVPISKSMNQSRILTKQGSLTIPAPLSRKTVDEVWSQIQRDQEMHPHQNNITHGGNSGNAPLQATFAEMTLEDFLIKAGVVREQQNYGVFQQNNMDTDFAMGGGERPGFGHGMDFGFVDNRNTGNGIQGGIPGYPGFQNGEGSSFGGNGNGGFPGVYSVSPDRIGTSQVDNSVSQYGFGMARVRGSGRKRIVMDGAVEKVVEKKQLRMIKNRESAARSRARKQAQTMELEAERNELKEENELLRKEIGELEAEQRKKFLVDVKQKMLKAAREGKPLRRAKSCPPK